VDLDGAFAGEPQNLATVQAIVALGMKVQFGGGLRTRAAVERALGFGVSRVVIGTRAAESEAFVGELVQAFGEKSRSESTRRAARWPSKVGSPPRA